MIDADASRLLLPDLDPALVQAVLGRTNLVALVDSMRLSWRYARLTDRPFLRLGLRLVTAGAAFAVTYCAEKALYIAIPSWGPRTASAGTRLRRYRTYRRLRPLWQLLYRATPEIALHPAAGRRDIMAEVRDLTWNTD